MVQLDGLLQQASTIALLNRLAAERQAQLARSPWHNKLHADVLLTHYGGLYSLHQSAVVLVQAVSSTLYRGRYYAARASCIAGIRSRLYRYCQRYYQLASQRGSDP